jgi:hypothetical protein
VAFKDGTLEARIESIRLVGPDGLPVDREVIVFKATRADGVIRCFFDESEALEWLELAPVVVVAEGLDLYATVRLGAN